MKKSPFLVSFLALLLLCASPLGLGADADYDSLPDNWEAANGRNPSKPDYAIASAANHLCVIDDAGVKCQGSNTSGQLNVPASLQNKSLHPYALSAGSTWSCACHDGGSTCWGVGYPSTRSCAVQRSSAALSAFQPTNPVCQTTYPGVSYYNGLGATLNCSAVTGVCSITGPVTSQVASTTSSPYYCSAGPTYSVAPNAVPLPVGTVQVGQYGGYLCVLSTAGLACYTQNIYGSWGVPANGQIAANWSFSGPTATQFLVDSDGDGVERVFDFDDFNAAESIDTDHDGIGNNTDTDDDADSVQDSSDNCSLVANANQMDADGDGAGDVCDSDTDGDGIDNNVDADDDNDGVADAQDKFPLDASESVDTDRDGIGNNADTDDDGDNTPDATDNCLLVANANQMDTDSDGAGDACDNDDDGDGVTDLSDTCPLVANLNQLNSDWDDAGDACDADDDNDSVTDALDAFPQQWEASVDTDHDGAPDSIASLTAGSPPIQYGGWTGTNGSLSVTLQNSWQSSALKIKVVTGRTNNFSYFRSSDEHSVALSFNGGGGSPSLNLPYSNPGSRSFSGGSLSVLEWVASQYGMSQGPSNFYVSLHTFSALTKDNDDDNDGVTDTSDAFPLNAAEAVDTDHDGIGNNADLDDDNDGVPDYIDADPLSAGNAVERVLPVNSDYKGSSVVEAATAP